MLEVASGTGREMEQEAWVLALKSVQEKLIDRSIALSSRSRSEKFDELSA